MEKRYKILLSTIDRVKSFIDITSVCNDVTLDIANGNHVVDGKSILGIFSLNITGPLELIIRGDNEDVINNTFDKLKSFEA